MKKLLSTFILALAIFSSASLSAQDNTSAKGKNGGLILGTGDVRFEVITKPGQVIFYPTDIAGNAFRAKASDASIDVLYMGSQSSITYNDVKFHNGCYTIFTDHDMIPWIYTVRTRLGGKMVEEKLRLPENAGRAGR